MRVTIGHREETAGVLGNKRSYYVDLSVELSEEERAIIQARRLGDHIIALSPGYIGHYQTKGGFIGAGFLQGICGLLMLSGFIVGLFVSEGLGYLLFFAGPVCWAIGKFSDYKGSHVKDKIALRDLMSARMFSITASSPASGKHLESLLRARLKEAKDFLAASAEIGAVQTFEI